MRLSVEIARIFRLSAGRSACAPNRLRGGLTIVYDGDILKTVDGLERLWGCEGFEWDKFNAGKIREKHRVLPSECEQVFFNRPLVVSGDREHSAKENRYYALGQTDAGRKLFVVFTVRKKRLRVISARAMSRKERKVYEDYEKDTEIQE